MMPRLLLLGLIGLAGIPLAIGTVVPDAGRIGILLTLIVIATALIDLAISPPLLRIEVSRQAGDVMSVGAKNAVTIRLTNHNSVPMTVEVHDEPPLRRWSPRKAGR